LKSAVSDIHVHITLYRNMLNALKCVHPSLDLKVGE